MWLMIDTYYKGRCQVSIYGRSVREAVLLLRILRGPISACSLAKTETFISGGNRALLRKAKVNLLNLARIANVFEILNPNLREQALQ